jgi:hypothetical protein
VNFLENNTLFYRNNANFCIFFVILFTLQTIAAYDGKIEKKIVAKLRASLCRI